jgi:hypothetical protein
VARGSWINPFPDKSGKQRTTNNEPRKKAGPKTGFFMPEEQTYFLVSSLAGSAAGAAGAAAASAGAAASFGASAAGAGAGAGAGAAAGAGAGGGGGASLLQPTSISVASAAISTERFMF